ncbi:MAG: leucine-rich repeat domain-containing protein [Candidatus Thorarchaeota archaeon]
MKGYNGINIDSKDLDVLTNIGQKLGFPLKYKNFFDDGEIYISAFNIRDEKIIHLMVTDKKHIFKHFPLEIIDLDELEILFVYMSINSIPQEIFSHKTLKVLSIDGANLVDFPKINSINRKIEFLAISNSSLRKISNSIGNLKSLKELHLNGNQLEKIPNEFNILISLETLDLVKNKINELPNTINNLKSLTELNLAYNELQTLPNSINSFSSLQNLILFQNPITTLPESLLELKNLKNLDLRKTQVNNQSELIKNLRKRRVRVLT